MEGKRDLRETLTGWLIGCLLAVGVLVGDHLLSTTSAIKASRHAACVDQNTRHNKTVSTLQAIVAAEVKKTPSQAAQIEASVAPTELLISALAPLQDCSKVAPG